MADMGALVLKRLASGLVVILIVVTLVFFLVRSIGDPATLALGEDATQQTIDAFRERHGLDRSLGAQYVTYVVDATQGNFGVSTKYGEPAMPIVLSRLPETLKLSGIALLLAIMVAVPLGMYAARRPGSYIDSFSRALAVAGQSTPIFWFGILLILLFSVQWPILPAVGTGTWQHLVLPSIALAFWTMPLIMRLSRSSMLDVLSKDYMKTAYAKGLSERTVIVNHALRNASIPVITIIGIRASGIVSGTVLLEEVFAYPGMGRLAINSMRQLDFAVIQAVVFVVATMVIGVNLLVDIVYGIVDPRIRVK